MVLELDRMDTSLDAVSINSNDSGNNLLKLPTWLLIFWFHIWTVSEEVLWKWPIGSAERKRGTTSFGNGMFIAWKRCYLTIIPSTSEF